MLRAIRDWHRGLALATLVLLAAGGCSSYRSLRAAQLAEERGEWDQAVLHYIDLTEQQPGSLRYKSALLRARLNASQEHFTRGRRFHEAGVLDRALVEYQQATQLDPTNQYAQVELDKVRLEIAAEQANGPGGSPTLDELKKKTRDVGAQPPALNPRSKEPISLDFPKPVSIFDIYRALGKAFGINVLFDPNLKDQDLAIELRDVTAQTALETLMRSAGHFYKVIDEHSILIAADNQQNRKTYEDLVIQTFFLSNAEIKEVLTLLRSLIGAKNLATNEQLNAVTIRDTADKVKVAQRIIEAIDKAKSEVVVDVELIQVNTSKLRDFGMNLSNYSIGQQLDLGGSTSGTGGTSTSAPIRLRDLKFLNQNSWAFTLPSISYNFLKSNTDAQLLAKPQLRISEGEKGKVHIGDRVPIPVTSFNTAQTAGGNIIPVTSFQYQDVGIKIDIEPRVHHNKEVTLKLQIEVSQISGFQDAGGGQKQPIIGTRTIESTIRLKDGETNFLAGLIRTDETNGESGIPGLSEIPLLGRIFGNTTQNVQRTDVMLTLTPHIIRTPDISEDDLLPIWVGTEANISFRAGSPRVESDAEGPFDEGGGPEATEQKIREQVQRLPRGLREGEGARPAVGGVPPAAQPPSGINLAPGGMPSNPFGPAEQPKGEQKPEPPEEEEPPPSAAALAPAGEPLDTLPSVGSVASVRDDAPSVRLSLSPRAASLAVGETFAMTVEVDARTPVAHLPMTLAYDPAVVEVVAVTAGDFLGRADAAQVVADTSRPGEIVIGASRRAGTAAVAGSGTLVRIILRALASGVTDVTFGAERVLDPDLESVGGVRTVASTVEVHAAASPPPGQGSSR
ncbi:MAG: cohesin domain-containing protein [Thermoanaerobaculia bacterium]